MAWIPVAERLPKPFERVWVKTDSDRQTTAYVKSDGEWFINCPRIRETGSKVLLWRE